VTRAELDALIDEQCDVHGVDRPVHAMRCAFVNVAMAYAEAVREPCGCDADVYAIVGVTCDYLRMNRLGTATIDRYITPRLGAVAKRDAMPSEAHGHAVAAHAALLDAHAQGVAHGAAMADERWQRRIKELEARAARARDALDGGGDA
jgi:hypothetical protein